LEKRDKISLRARPLSHPARGSSDERLREGAEPPTEVLDIQASENRLREGGEPQTEVLDIQASENRMREGAGPPD
jgi:hypothetical protein